MMEKTKIGLNAGKVWRILNEKGELSMFDLCRELSLTFEDKIFLRKREGMLFASIENVEFTFG
ncbi:winged helix-turn-helix domain-containing protein [Odoribacter laneus]|uniref:winged helix-turn-helix domain-containing protein n=1 Tax=Odoribacter laneus TaxID=626933 RepID=UPI003FF0C0E1